MRFFDTTDLEWRPAFRRAGFFVALWLLTIYALSVAFPDTFYLGLDTSGGVFALLFNAFLFFLLFTFITALSERRRKRARRSAAGHETKRRAPRASASSTEEAERTDSGELKGRHNPNTSRKKASRRRRR